TSILVSSFPRPMPAKLCKVTPPILHAARPVEAVTAKRSGSRAYFFLSSWMMARISTDLPVPAGPVKKTLCPSSITSSLTCRCS
ncbi:hypothetical protein N657DRAFT_533159, partial [Parathielavia appendiculata]